MYSPKISEDLIPILYALAKEKNIPMTRVVDQIIRDSLEDMQSYQILDRRQTQKHTPLNKED